MNTDEYFVAETYPTRFRLRLVGSEATWCDGLEILPEGDVGEIVKDCRVPPYFHLSRPLRTADLFVVIHKLWERLGR